MFSELDNIIFPDSCEVIKVTSQHYVFPIFKCGSTSLVESMPLKGWTFVDKKEILDITTPIIVFLRDPQERFVSGVNTFLYYLQRQDRRLDAHTILFFINKYLFLDRHYAPQFFWLLNLAKFAGPDTLVTFRDMKEISKLTKHYSDAGIPPMTNELRQQIESLDWSKLEMYLYLDKILLGYINQVRNIHEVIEEIKRDHQELYQLLFKNPIDIVNVLPKT